ncbi:MAG: transporter substrate-binding domain-containing protein [Psychrobium sp.]|nr:transporter substrate-binding domain-containing protein [Psychrobium sp.]
MDGLFGFSRTVEQEHEFSFSPVYFFAPIDIVVPRDNNEIDNLSSLNYKTVLTFKGFAINNTIRDKAPNAQLVFISSKEQAIDKLLNNEADAAISSFAASVINDSVSLKVSQLI